MEYAFDKKSPDIQFCPIIWLGVRSYALVSRIERRNGILPNNLWGKNQI